MSGSCTHLSLNHFHPRYWPTWFIIGLLSILWLIPRRQRDALAARMADLYARKDSNHRHYAQVNLALCFPHLSIHERRQMLRTHFRRFFQVMSDSPLFWWGSDAMIKKRVFVSGQEAADKAIRNGESVIFLVSHSIALDVCSSLLTIDYPMQGVYKPFKNAVFEWLVFRMRTKRGGRLAARGEGFKTVIRDLKKGVTLFYLSDEDLGREGSVFAPFFGQSKATLAMLPRITKIADAKVFPVYAHYLPECGKYQISILPQLHDYPDGDPYTDAKRMNEVTEESIMICPEQYLWKLRLFKTQANPAHKAPYKKVKEGSLKLEI